MTQKILDFNSLTQVDKDTALLLIDTEIIKADEKLLKLYKDGLAQDLKVKLQQGINLYKQLKDASNEVSKEQKKPELKPEVF